METSASAPFVERAEELTDVPPSLAPPPPVPPIQDFDRVVSQPSVDRAASANGPGEDKEAACAAQRQTASSHPHPLPGARNVPARGVFSLRSSAALLHRSPSKKKKDGEQEVEAAGWDAAAYPFDAAAAEEEKDWELDRMIKDLVRDIEGDPLLHEAAPAKGTHTTTVKETAPTDTASPSASSVNSSMVTALPVASGAQFESINPDHEGAGQPCVPHEEDAVRRDGSHMVAEGSADIYKQPRDSDSATSSPSQERGAEEVVEVVEVVERAETGAKADSPATDRWKVLSPPRQSDKHCWDGEGEEEDATEEFHEKKATHPAKTQKAERLRESSPVYVAGGDRSKSSAVRASPDTHEGQQATAVLPRRGAERAAARRQSRRSVAAADTEVPTAVLRVAPSTKTSPHRSAQPLKNPGDSSSLHVVTLPNAVQLNSRTRRPDTTKTSEGDMQAEAPDPKQEQEQRQEDEGGGGGGDSTEATAKKHRKGSFADPTISWERRLSAAAEKGEDQEEGDGDGAAREAAPCYPKTEEGTTVVGEFHLVTEQRRQAAERKHRIREERRRQLAEKEEQQRRESEAERLRRIRQLPVAAKPKGYDAIAEEGRRKRQLLEEEERRRQQEAEENVTFKPKISRLAMQRRASALSPAAAAATTAGDTGKKRAVTAKDVEQFVAASKEWELKREHRLGAVQRRLKEEEEVERKRRFVNEETERIVSRKQQQQQQQQGSTSAPSVFERLADEGASRKAAQKRLEEKYTPSFQPETHRHGSINGDSNRRTEQCTTESGQQQQQEESPVGGQGRGSIDFFEDLYQRSTQQKAEAERRLQKKREEELAALHHPSVARSRDGGDRSGSNKRSEKDIEAYVEQMAARDAERRAKFQQKIQREREAEEAAAAAEATSLVNPHSAQIANRGRQRIQMREEQRQRARELEEQQRRKEEEAAAAAATRNAHKTPVKLSPSFEAHEMRSEERRAHNLGRLRQQLLEQEMAECTFKPQVCRASEEMASRVRYSHLEEVEHDVNNHDEFDTFQGTPPHDPLSLSPSLEHAYRPVVARPLSGPSPVRSDAPRRTTTTSLQSGQDQGTPSSAVAQQLGRNGSAAAPADASPAPRQPRRRDAESEDVDQSPEEGPGGPALAVARGTSGGSSSQPPPRSTASLEQEIESLEQVLRQWKQMENEVAV